ncbi:MAG: 3-methyl-2-oxobutanoate hydroxymethyltransferase [Betaproteobacteria bacterium]|nr:3-methyl-2-oxobutanoate hydroxymethyltransferase [Betaproteobacteria bacterium]MBI2508460.1 3-methyl-2-oxobutanoate hydroxymethyltransferase [Betaproteobacteria bacterium]
MRITLNTLQKMAQEGNRIAMLTCYDASFAALLEAAGVDCLLVGDSLGNVLQGHETTLPVTLRDMVYHTQCVARGARRAFVIADMPFGTFQQSPQETFRNAAELMAAGAQMVKIEGGAPMVETIEFLTDRGIPVCGHLGLTPQSVHQFGGYRVQGKGESEGQRLLREAKQLERAGAGMLVLEAVPAALAREITAAVSSPTIGIGAGVDCHGQVLVLHDMLDVYPGRKAKFVKNYMRGAGSIQGAVELYVKEVKARTFPGPEHSF